MQKRNKYNYRRIWKNYNKSIPLDENGVSYDIHHIDGDKINNDINNLLAVSVKEHYEIHYKQKDWGACKALSMRVNIPYKERAKITSKVFKGKKLSEEHKQKIGKANKGRVQSKEEREKRKFPRPGSGPPGPRSEEIKHNISKAKKGQKYKGGIKRPGAGPQGPRSEETKEKMRGIRGKYGEQPKVVCCFCGKKGGNNIMKRWHFNNCKYK